MEMGVVVCRGRRWVWWYVDGGDGCGGMYREEMCVVVCRWRRWVWWYVEEDGCGGM
jgi:hypothetical protein